MSHDRGESDTTARPLILVLDGDRARRERLARMFARRGYAVATADLVASALDRVAGLASPVQALVLESRVPDGTAADLLAAWPLPLPRPFVLVHGDWPEAPLPHRPPGVDACLAQSSPTFATDVLRRVEDAVPLRPCSGIPTVRRGDHLILVYEARPTLLDSLGAFFSCGLSEGERCVLACEDSSSADEIRAHFERLGIDVERLERQGALSLLEHEESYFVGGRFDPRVMLEFIGDLVASALEDGFTGLRASGEGSWLPETPEDREVWFRYEAELEPYFAERTLTAACLYRLSLDATTLIDALRTHPVLLDGRTVCENVYFARPYVPGPGGTELDLRAQLAEVRGAPRLAAS